MDMYEGKLVCRSSHYHQGPVVQSIVSLTSSLVVKMLTLSIDAILNYQSFKDLLTNDIVHF